MDYNFREIEAKWRTFWAENKTFRAEDHSEKPKYYVLDMFPYPSGAGLHVGHPLGYIASDIYSRYKRLKGFNVLHPMGYDSFGLPAEQYAIQTGQHPRITTEQNIARYRDQLDKIGFSFDWEREVRTSSPEYYKWTQWIFKQLYNAYYDNQTDKAEPIEKLIATFENEGNTAIDACTDFEEVFSADDWKGYSEEKQNSILQEYRLTYLADSWVNWCPGLGTVLANDEVVNGVSEREGHPVEQKLMRQWSMRIKAYAERLLTGLDKIDWSDSIKDQQRNWIGKSRGASVRFEVDGFDKKIEVFTTRPDTIYGVSFMVLAPEHPFVDEITTDEFASNVAEYKRQASLKSERDRQSDVKNITGQNTGAFAIHPFSGEKVPIWIGDYVLASYGTGAVMAVPCGDQRDWDFAKHFGIEIKNIFKDIDISEEAYTEKDAVIANSDFLNDMPANKAIKTAIYEIEQRGIGKGKTQYRLRDAVFSRQRYWGEPFPVYYKGETPYLVSDEDLPITLPEVDKYLPTEDGEPPLARAKKEDWNHFEGDRMEYNTMPGWAGSSWYFLRYMDPKNDDEFVARDKVDYWNNVDLYIGGSEHATGHLLYARFWTKFLYDMGYIPFDEPFQKMINQGMILGNSAFHKVVDISVKVEYLSHGGDDSEVTVNVPMNYQFLPMEEELDSDGMFIFDVLSIEGDANSNLLVKRVLSDAKNLNEGYELKSFHLKELNVNFTPTLKRIPVNCIDKNDDIILKELQNNEFYSNMIATSEDNTKYHCLREVEKMSKSKLNVETPDYIVDKFGADTLRMYEMFLGPLEQSKPWDTKGINGVHNFLRKLWRLFHDQENKVVLDDGEPTKDALKTLHKTIKKIEDDLDRFSFNTGVSNFMICVNELSDQKCNNKQILEQLTILLSPYAPHIAEELWVVLGNEAGTISYAKFPEFNEDYLVEANYAYPVSFNGKMRFKLELPTALTPQEVEQEVLAQEQAQKWLEGKEPKKVIVVPGKIVNIVV